MSTKFMVEVEGDDTDPESTIREAARVLAVAFHSVVSARDMSSEVKVAYIYNHKGNPVHQPEEVEGVG
jgi:hypothetical protein